MRSERTVWRSLTRFGTLFVAGVVVLVFLGLGFGREYLRNREIERNIAELEAQNDELESEQLAALSVIESLSSEYYLEGEARRKRGLASPGEELVVIGGADAAGTDVLVANDATKEAANIVRWYYYFFNRRAFDALTTL